MSRPGYQKSSRFSFRDIYSIRVAPICSVDFLHVFPRRVLLILSSARITGFLLHRQSGTVTNHVHSSTTYTSK